MITEVEPAVFGVAEAAVYLHLNADEVRRLMKVGELPGWRTFGSNRGFWRTSRRACDEWIALQEERGRMELSQ